MNLRELISGLQLRFSAGLSDGALVLELLITNHNPTEARLCLSLNVVLPTCLLGDATGNIPFNLPDSPIRAGSIDTATRGAFPPRSVATLGTAETPVRIEVEPVTGVNQLHVVSPMGHDVVSLIASACGEPNGTLTVAASEAFQMGLTLRVAIN